MRLSPFPSILAPLIAGTGFLSAGMKVPSSVYHVNDLEEATVEAREKGKALSFVLTDTKTNPPPPTPTEGSPSVGP